MPTLRQLRFDLINKKNKYLSPEVVDKFLCDYFSLTPVQYLLEFDKQVKIDNKINELINRIASGEPYQYVFSKAIFLQTEFYVDPHVLIPRQETEQLVLELIKEVKIAFKEKKIRILDIGSGSGNIGILLGKNIKNAEICAIDISKEAIDITNKNAKKNRVLINTRVCDIFDDAILKLGKFDVIVSNPPYIKDYKTVDSSTLTFEPHIALFSFEQLAFYKRIFSISKTMLNDTGILGFEIEENMTDMLKNEIMSTMPNYQFKFSRDIYNKDRYLFMKKSIDLDKIRSVLINDGVVAFPTDTVMGLGILYDNDNAFHKLENLKNRPSDKPYTLMVGSKEDISKFANVNTKVSRLINNMLPGPLTLLLPAKDNLPYNITKGHSSVGIRLAPTEAIKKIILKCGKPLLVPSANKCGDKPAIDSDEVRKIFNNQIDFIVEGKAELEEASTIVDLTKDRPTIIRQGKIKLVDILKAMEE